MFELEDVTGESLQACIKVVGVGGAGGNVINNMITSNIRNVEFIAVNTDAQVLETSLAPKKIQIGTSITRGLGAGSKPEVGRESALEDRETLANHLKGADMVFITAGMGGGTGTGAAPVIAEIAHELGALTVAVVTKPFFYEGGIRKRNAEAGVNELQSKVDTMIVIPNDRIAMVVAKGTSLLQSFSIANDVLKHAVQGISDLILVPGLINLDYADVKTVIEDAGRAVIGMGTGKGEGGAHDAAKTAIMNQLLENSSIEGAEGVLINITGGLEMSLSDIEAATSPIYEVANAEANIMVGAVIDPELKDEIRVTVIATRFSPAAIAQQAQRPQQTAPQSQPQQGGLRPETMAPMAATSMMNRPQQASVQSAPAQAPVKPQVPVQAPQPVMAASLPVQKAPVQEAMAIVDEVEAVCALDEGRLHEAVTMVDFADESEPVLVAEVFEEAPKPRIAPARPVAPQVAPQIAPQVARPIVPPVTPKVAPPVARPAVRPTISTTVHPESKLTKKKSPYDRPVSRKTMYRAVDRVLEKTLSIDTSSLLKDEDPLDIPTFLRKPSRELPRVH